MKDETSADRAAHEPDLNLLAAHFDRRLSSRETEDLVAHLAGCRNCRETAAFMTRALSLDSARRPGAPVVGWLALAATLVLATIVGIRISRVEPSPSTAPEPGPRPTAAASSPPLPEAVAAPAPARPAGHTDVRRGGDRTIAGKTFHLVAGEWVDRTFDPIAGLPIVDVSGPEARATLLAERPGLAPYLGLGNRVLVVLDGTVYRFGPAAR